MTNIGLIAEGVTDVTAIKHIVGRYLQNSVDVSPIQPKVIMKAGRLHQEETSEGGWAEVLAHCSDETFNDFFNSNKSNQYIIIQIDTDSCAHYGVDPLDNTNTKKSYATLAVEIRDVLLSKLSPAVRTLYEDKVIFAICGDEMECWLLPLVMPSLAANKMCVNNCVYHLNQIIGRDGYSVVPDNKNSQRSQVAYSYVLRQMKRKSLDYMRAHTEGLDEFLTQLDGVVIENEDYLS